MTDDGGTVQATFWMDVERRQLQVERRQLQIVDRSVECTAVLNIINTSYSKYTDRNSYCTYCSMIVLQISWPTACTVLRLLL